MKSEIGSITELLRQIDSGEMKARDELFQKIYIQLKTIAQRESKRQGDPELLQTTAVVNEACMKMASDGFQVSFENRKELFAAANRAIRFVLIDYARKKTAKKRNPENRSIVARQLESIQGTAGGNYADLDEALVLLADSYPRIARVVEAKFFGQLTNKETAKELGISIDTVKRDWRFGRAFLYEKLHAK